MKKKLSLFLIITLFGLIAGVQGIAQTAIARELKFGIQLYTEGKWEDAVQELRRARTAARNDAEKAEALYWIALSELSAGAYSDVLRDLDELELLAPGGKQAEEIPYHRGRALYYLGWYDEAILAFNVYASRISETAEDGVFRKASAFFWVGECLYALGQFEPAEEIFTLIVEKYPQTAKYEAANYRIALINQKKVEAELLNILKWSHEESLKTVEVYQHRERSYDQAIIAYQKQITDLLQGAGLVDLEDSNAEYRRKLLEAERHIDVLEANLREANAALEAQERGSPYLPPPGRASAQFGKHGAAPVS
ncbi:hypothetical protein FACS189468_0910 [Spirochaetia bacterium]|nr:hypothetical protein FACS189468_0910 [Spirochaetia bacterium]